MSRLDFTPQGLVSLAVLVVACRPTPDPESPPTTPEPTPVVTDQTLPIVALAVSSTHGCAVEGDGGLRCWGPDADELRTVDLPPVRAVVATKTADCVAFTTGEVRCWGRQEDKTFDGVVEGLADVDALEGNDWVCAGNNRGDVHCFEPGSPNPPMLRAREAVDFDAHDDNGCAIDRDGKLSCWRVDKTARDYRLAVPAGVVQVETGGGNVCIVDELGRVGCASLADLNRDQPNVLEPLEVAGEVQSLALGSLHGCVVGKERSTRCFGNNGWAQLGVGHSQPSSEVAIHEAGSTAIVAAAEEVSCAVNREGEIRCWGRWDRGLIPDRVQALDEVVAIGATNDISCAERRDHTVLCWGALQYGELDDDPGGIVAAATPTPIPLKLDGLQALYPKCFLDRAKLLRCGYFSIIPGGSIGAETIFGNPYFNSSFEHEGVLDHAQRIAGCTLLESGSSRTIECADGGAMFFVPKLRKPLAVALEGQLACAAQERGPIACWNLLDESTFEVPGIRDAIDLQSDYKQFCALLRSGDVYCWASEHEAKPQRLPFSGLVKFAGNQSRACGIQADGKLTCIEAQTGAPSFDPISNVVDVVVGADHHCILTTDAKMTCFGSNRFGQLGGLPPNILLTPTQIE